MLGLRFAEYINSNMAERKWKLKDLERESGVSDSTLTAYKRGLSNKPTMDNMIRIAAAFGDPPSVIEDMLSKSDAVQTEEEKRLIAEAADQARLERISSMLRENMVQILNEFREQSAAQQTEIIQHADKRIADAQEDFDRRNTEVLNQCKQEIEREKAHCQQRIDDMQKYATFVYTSEREHRKDLRIRNEHSREYLKSCVRNISACCLLLGLIAFMSSVYSIFAFFAFDLSDPSRGLYQGSSIVAALLLVSVVSILILIAWRLLVIYKRKETDDGKNDEEKPLEEIEP